MASIKKTIKKRKQDGYTILEVIIVLTVSSLLFATAVAGYSLQNRRTQFTNSVNSFAQDIQDVLNDVEVGFYPTTAGFSCSSGSSGKPDIDYGESAQQGTNVSCIFVGKAIQFAPDGDDSEIDIYTIVGRSMTEGADPEPVIKIEDAKPVALIELVESKSLISGIEIEDVQTFSGVSLSGLAMVSTSSSSGGISTGLNARASLAAIPGSPGEPGSLFRGGPRVESIDSSSIDIAQFGMRICLREGGIPGRSAIIELAIERSQIIVDTKIDESCTT